MIILKRLRWRNCYYKNAFWDGGKSELMDYHLSKPKVQARKQRPSRLIREMLFYNRLAENPARLRAGMKASDYKLSRPDSDSGVKQWGFPQDSCKLAKEHPPFQGGEVY